VISIFIYIWEYFVKPDSLLEFEKTYGSNGRWNKFFKKSDKYIKTDLLKDKDSDNRYITVDYWKTKKDHDEFVNFNFKTFNEIDKACEQLTLKEAKLGNFDLKS